MTPAQLQAWASAAAALASGGVMIGTLIKSWIPQAHPDLTPEQLAADYAAIMADDLVRAALAAQAAGGD